MIGKAKGELFCECNECGREEYGGTLDFKDFVQYLKDNQWKIFKDGEEWTHTCPECVELNSN